MTKADSHLYVGPPCSLRNARSYVVCVVKAVFALYGSTFQWGTKRGLHPFVFDFCDSLLQMIPLGVLKNIYFFKFTHKTDSIWGKIKKALIIQQFVNEFIKVRTGET